MNRTDKINHLGEKFIEGFCGLSEKRKKLFDQYFEVCNIEANLKKDLSNIRLIKKKIEELLDNIQV